ncbi:tyrosine-type recombinase/integrase [Pedobacter flavus]|uniref:Tyrosine-type recombinase/integrase n=1 Tax=Pedobacter flavus TaxID=3113906 RepID=A0ABU7H1K5_9SPHI|nr:tyrosine-type recombinase/integrase [Pedobacter sp. VNH31]MEE1885134.1 tyrosine-type recombinase/integrase [Pedobacter sp. VNH31]
MVGDEFLQYLKNEKRYSSHTLLAYSNDIQVFSNYLQDLGINDLLKADTSSIRTYIVFLMEQGLDPSSTSRKLSALRSLYKFALKTGKIKKDPIQAIKAPKLKKKLPVFIEDDKLISLLNSPVIFAEDFEGLRDRLVVELLFGTGMRLSELIKLKDSDIDNYQQQLKVIGKRNKERLIPIPLSVLNLANNFIKYKSLHKINNQTDKLIVTSKGEEAYPGLIYRIVKRYLSLISTQEKKSPHVLRHSYATSLLNNGADLNAIKELLGHASLAATQVYVHNSIERLKTVYKQAHPKA